MLNFLKKIIDKITLYFCGFVLYAYLYRYHIGRIIHRLVAILFMFILLKHMFIFNIDKTFYEEQNYKDILCFHTLNFCLYHCFFVYRIVRDEYIKSPFYEHKFKCLMTYCFIIQVTCIYLNLMECIFFTIPEDALIFEDGVVIL